MAKVMEYPGVYFEEVEFNGTTRVIDGVNMSVGGCVIISEKGEVGRAVRCTSFDDFISKYGGAIQHGFGYYAVKGFFENGGNYVWVSRAVHYENIDNPTPTPKYASVTLDDCAESSHPTLKFSAKSIGSCGNLLSVKTVKNCLVNTTLAEKAVSGTNTIVVSSPRYISSGKTLLLGTEVVTVAKINGRNVTLTSNISGELPAETKVVSSEFDLYVYDDENVVEKYESLDLNPNSENYVVVKLDDNSKYIKATDLVSSSTFPKNYPVLDENGITYNLLGGTDEYEAITSVDFIGSPATKTGLYAFDNVSDCLTLFIPESQDVTVNNALLTYCENSAKCFAVISVPEGLTVEQAEKYRLDQGNFNSSYGALYYNYGYVTDPIGVGKNPERLVPLDGHIAGVIARTSYGEAPAGEEKVLRGVNRLEHEIGNTENGILNKINVNCLRDMDSAGLVVWGARTLSSDTKFRYIHARRIFIYAEQSILKGTRWSVFKGTNNRTWQEITRTVTNFMSNVEGLYGETKAERFLVICDETINTQEVRERGEILTKIGMNIESIGEFVLFQVGQIKSGATITDLSA